MIGGQNYVGCDFGNYSAASDDRRDDSPGHLLSVEGLHRILTRLVTNLTGFAPLGTVLVALLGLAVAAASGLVRTVSGCSWCHRRTAYSAGRSVIQEAQAARVLFLIN